MNMKKLDEPKLNTGQLIKIFADDDSFHVLQFDGTHYANLTNVNLTPDVWHIYNHWSKWELTTAYDAGIEPKELPIPEPIDSTGWVIYKEDSEGPMKLKETFKHKHDGALCVRYCADEWTGGWDYAIDVQPCLPPEQEPEQWDLNIHYWDKNKKVKGSIVLDPQSNDYLFIWIRFKKDSLLGDYCACSPHVDIHEPYNNQDAKIDFGKAYLVLKHGEWIVRTTGNTQRDSSNNVRFEAVLLNGKSKPVYYIAHDNWQDITEQFNELLKQL